jgi:hypothetical protein
MGIWFPVPAVDTLRTTQLSPLQVRLANFAELIGAAREKLADCATLNG